MFPVTVVGAHSAESLYREGAVLFDVGRGELAWNGQHHRIVDLLGDAPVILAYGTTSATVSDVTRLFDGWGFPAWKVTGTEVENLRRRVTGEPLDRSET